MVLIVVTVLFFGNTADAKNYTGGVYKHNPAPFGRTFGVQHGYSVSSSPAPVIRLEKTAVSKIRLAAKTIDIAINNIPSKKFNQAVEDAAEYRGVNVRVIYVNGNTFPTRSIFSNIVCRKSPGHLDEEIIIVDGTKVLTGEFGEYEFTFTEPDYIKKYQDKFDGLWKNVGLLPTQTVQSLAPKSTAIEQSQSAVPSIPKSQKLSDREPKMNKKNGYVLLPGRKTVLVRIDDIHGDYEKAAAYPLIKEIIKKELAKNGLELVDILSDHDAKKVPADYVLSISAVQYDEGYVGDAIKRRANFKISFYEGDHSDFIIGFDIWTKPYNIDQSEKRYKSFFDESLDDGKAAILNIISGTLDSMFKEIKK